MMLCTANRHIHPMIQFVVFVWLQNAIALCNDDDSFDRQGNRAPLVIPFELTKANNILVHAKLNDRHSIRLMFHTANSSVCLTKAATKKISDLKFDQQIEASSWGGKSTMRFSDGNSLKIGDRSWNDVAIYEDTHSGPGSDGKFGPDLFAGQYIEIDFDRNVLCVSKVQPASIEGFQELQSRKDRSSLFIRGTILIGDRRLEHEFMMHSGYGGTVLLDEAFVERHRLNHLKTIDESQLKDSFGNVIKTKKVLLPNFQIGESTLKDLQASFFDGSIGRQRKSVLGGDVLKRFNWIVVPDRSRVFLKPNSLF